MVEILPVRMGSNPSIFVTFADALTDAATPLTGCTGFSATAKHTVEGDVVTFQTVTLLDGAAGKVRLNYTTDMFTKPGLWDLLVKCTDSAGEILGLPVEEGQLKVRIGS